MTVRQPAVAGSFYPADAEVLDAIVRRCLDAAGPPPAGRLRALIAPHAGYPYCGRIAGAAFGLLSAAGHGGFEHVLHIGPSHTAHFAGLAVSPAGSWRTPLGDVPVTYPGGLERCTSLHADAAPHEHEHCLEVQVPFLQIALTHFELTPLLTGRLDPTVVAAELDGAIDDRTLVVASTDLSHFLPDRQARAADRISNECITGLDTEGFGEKGDACGKTAVLILMYLARRHGWRPQLLAYATSADACGDQSQVVGYTAFAFTEGAARA